LKKNDCSKVRFIAWQSTSPPKCNGNVQKKHRLKQRGRRGRKKGSGIVLLLIKKDQRRKGWRKYRRSEEGLKRRFLFC
jgi:hypothetical protein